MTTNNTVKERVMRSWVDYKVGDYKKKFYDIKTMAKHTYYGCWPNAGYFHIDGGEQIDEHFVIKVRPSKLNDLGMPDRTHPHV